MATMATFDSQVTTWPWEYTVPYV